MEYHKRSSLTLLSLFMKLNTCQRTRESSRMDSFGIKIGRKHQESIGLVLLPVNSINSNS
jgi:hypothetical protein